MVAFPTETVYGLGADARNPGAVARIFAIKGRPHTHPLIVHLGDAALLDEWCERPSAAARLLAERFWPGPLTVVVRRAAHVLDAVTGGLSTVALRVPAHPVALSLLVHFGGGIAAPSANRFGAVSPTTAAHVRDDLGAAVDLILDGGACEVGLESTIVDVSGTHPAILRPGGVAREAIEAVLGLSVPLRHGGPVRSPGQMRQHYAPRARVERSTRGALAARAAALLAQGLRVAVWVSRPAPALPAAVDLLDAGDGTVAQAQTLYAALREVDRRGCDVVLVVEPEAVGIGLAVADRLRRAQGEGAGYDAGRWTDEMNGEGGDGARGDTTAPADVIERGT